MPKGQEFSVELKKVFFRVIDFMEKERTGPIIPLSLSTARLVAALGISERSIFNLKTEMKNLRDEERSSKEKIGLNERQLRSRASSSGESIENSSLIQRSHRHRQFSASSVISTSFVSVPDPLPPKKTSNSGRPQTLLSESESDEIRLTFHLILSQRIYPTTQMLLDHLMSLNPDFPITSKTSLWRHMKKIGFRFNSTGRVSIALDDVKFVAQRAYFFRKLTELRSSNAKIFFHDETWTNGGDERRSIWVDDQGIGRLKKNEGKGKLVFRMTSSNMKGYNNKLPTSKMYDACSPIKQKFISELNRVDYR